jgi:hypothetical protein
MSFGDVLGNRARNPVGIATRNCRVIRTMLQHSIRRPLTTGLMAIAILLLAVGNALPCHAAQTRQLGQSKPLSHGSPQKKAPYQPGASPYKTGANDRPKYFVPPTNPRTPTWKMYGTPPRVTPGDWPTYAPFGFGGYRFPAVGSQAYR